MTKIDMYTKVAEIILDIPQCDGARDYVDIDEAAQQIVNLMTSPKCAICEQRRAHWAKQYLESFGHGGLHHSSPLFKSLRDAAIREGRSP